MQLIHSIINSDFAVDITVTGFILILCATLVCGILFSGLYVYNRRKDVLTKGFAMALVVVPIATTVVITMVGRNIAAGLGLSGIFVLVRFRSGPVQPRDLSYLFASICSGVLVGCGYVLYGLIYTALVLIVIFVLEQTGWGEEEADSMILKIWVPESLNFQDLFTPVLEKYTERFRLLMVRTTDFGSMCELRYRILPKVDMKQKEFIDEIRSKNGNMNVVLIIAPNIVESGSKQVL